jgi:serine phosphatase RsbU (regulator of sigma subunit)
MHAEDLLVFFTDGLIEEAGQHDEIFSQERLAEIIASLRTLPPKELLAKTLDAIRDFCGHQEFSDDVCLLGVEVKRLKTEK